jgi:hypothetical protein
MTTGLKTAVDYENEAIELADAFRAHDWSVVDRLKEMSPMRAAIMGAMIHRRLLNTSYAKAHDFIGAMIARI